MGCTKTKIIQINDNHQFFKKVKTIGKEQSNICHNFLIRSDITKEEYVYKRIIIGAMNKKEKDEILNNIKALKTIDHPNIISLKDAYYSPNKKYLYVISEYADSGDLQMKLDEQRDKNECFKEELLLNWFMQICFALNYIHNNNILHRNIKPSNIFLMKQNEDNFAKLGDFGIAKILKPSLRYTQTIINSSPKYLSPKILQKKEYSFKTDIWSLGVTFYELITLNYPFEGESDTEIEDNILKGNIKKIPDYCKVDNRFIELIKEMLSIRPEERPSAEEILERQLLNSIMKCYLESNNFDDTKAKNEINKYEKENKIGEFKEIRVLERDINDIITYEDDEQNIIIRAEKANYDFLRQMTNMKMQIKKSNTFPENIKK